MQASAIFAVCGIDIAIGERRTKDCDAGSVPYAPAVGAKATDNIAATRERGRLVITTSFLRSICALQEANATC